WSILNRELFGLHALQRPGRREKPWEDKEVYPLLRRLRRGEQRVQLRPVRLALSGFEVAPMDLQGGAADGGIAQRSQIEWAFRHVLHHDGEPGRRRHLG